MDTFNLLYCGFAIAQHKLLGPADIATTYMLALASFFILIHLDFVDFLTLLTSMQEGTHVRGHKSERHDRPHYRLRDTHTTGTW